MKFHITDTQAGNKLDFDLLLPLFKEFDANAVLKLVPGDCRDTLKKVLQVFKAAGSDSETIYFSDANIYLLGLGKIDEIANLSRIFRQFTFRTKSRFSSTIGIDLSLYPRECKRLAEAVVTGFRGGYYSAGDWKSGSKQDSGQIDDVFLYPGKGKSGEDLTPAFIERAEILADAQIKVMSLINTPSNIKNPAWFTEEVKKSAGHFGFNVSVFKGEEISENRLFALEAVNRGSEHPAHFLVMEYSPESGNAPHVGLVGKGVTYDTGGLSIKSSGGMYYMKSDMGGAAVVFGAFEAAVRLKLPVKLTCIIPLTDNLIDAKSIKPGDIIQSYSGKSIEIVDTDAEGRLILADALAWMVEHHKPDHIIDLATLTGATVRTLGYEAAGLFSNDSALAKSIEQAAGQTGEKVWPFPMWASYGEDLSSDTADIRNLGNKPVGGAIHAAKFLEFFIGEHPSWAHLDIAGVAFGDTEFGKLKTATGYGVHLLIHFLENLPKGN